MFSRRKRSGVSVCGGRVTVAIGSILHLVSGAGPTHTLLNLVSLQLGDFKTILVAAAGEADDNHLVLGSLRRNAQGFHDGMSGFQGRKNAFQARTIRKAVQRIRVGHMRVSNPAVVFPKTVLGADAGIIESGGDRVNRRGLAIAVLQHIALTAVQDARPAETDRGRVLTELRPASAGFDAD